MSHQRLDWVCDAIRPHSLCIAPSLPVCIHCRSGCLHSGYWPWKEGRVRGREEMKEDTDELWRLKELPEHSTVVNLLVYTLLLKDWVLWMAASAGRRQQEASTCPSRSNGFRCKIFHGHRKPTTNVGDCASPIYRPTNCLFRARVCASVCSLKYVTCLDIIGIYEPLQFQRWQLTAVFPRIWNNLSQHLKVSCSLSVFNCKMKSLLIKDYN